MNGKEFAYNDYMENLRATMAPNSTFGEQHSAIESNTYTQEYKEFARPLTASLLQTFQLDMSYTRGEGNWLWGHREDGIEKKIFDGTGGYGANLLGHSNPTVKFRAIELLNESPNMVQGSWRESAGKLGKKLSEMLSRETGKKNWITHQTNSGAECSEAALKHILLAYHFRQQQLEQMIERSAHLCPTYNPGPAKLFLKSHRPLVLALSGAYHGKTMGALSLTHNPRYKTSENSGPWEVIHLPPNDVASLEKFVANHTQLIELYDLDKKKMVKIPYLPLAGFFIEAIQVEGGIHCLDTTFVKEIRRICDQTQAPLIADEIQSGLFRTGKLAALSHHQVNADIYLFSKALGGGIAKIGVACIQRDHYQEEFGMLHTSTFAEDHFSSEIAATVLEIIDQPDFINRSLRHLEYTKEELISLQNQYPDIIKEIRGQGAMLAIEFQESLLELCFEFQILGAHGLFGHFLSSLLLNHEKIRIAPTLSSPFSLRFEPSLDISIDEIQFFSEGLGHLCQKLQQKDAQYLFANLGGQPKPLAPQKSLSLKGHTNPVTVFLCHTIDQRHLEGFCPSLSGLPKESYQRLSAGLANIGEFSPYVFQTISDHQGRKTDLIMMAAPIDSYHMAKALRSPQLKSKYIAKIQAAIDECAEAGVVSVGLGQFTSIITNNGLDLNARGMNLTTGNSFTAALSIEAGLAIAAKQGKNIQNLRVGVVGAAGNIMSTVGQFLYNKVGHLSMYYHTPWQQSAKWQAALNDLALAHNTTLEILTTQKNLSLEHSLNTLCECDLVFVGTNDPGLHFPAEMFKQNAIIIDASVPTHFGKEIRSLRPDLTIALGGLAQLPLDPYGMIQGLSSAILPCLPGECYACLTETLMMSWEGLRGNQVLGPVTLQSIIQTQKNAQACGVKLGRVKTRATF